MFTESKLEMLENRVRKNEKHLRKWARRNNFFAYRIYDRDILEFPLSIDLYELLPPSCVTLSLALQFAEEERVSISENKDGALRERKARLVYIVNLYKDDVDEEGEEEIKRALSRALEAEEKRIILKRRKRLRTKEGGEAQYEKAAHLSRRNDSFRSLTLEGDFLFFVDTVSYIDTGLFLDHRPLRKIIQAESEGKSVLNLFCYTGGFSVASSRGKAKRIVSVDLSRTYLEVAKKNMRINGEREGEFTFIRADAFTFMKECKEKFSLIILDPPTFSNSSMTRSVLDIRRDHKKMIYASLSLLEEGGTLYFSSNAKKFRLSSEILSDKTLKVIDISGKTTDRDYKNKKPHKTWKIQKEIFY